MLGGVVSASRLAEIMPRSSYDMPVNDDPPLQSPRAYTLGSDVSSLSLTTV